MTDPTAAPGDQARKREPWQIDHNIPVALLLGMALQLGAGIVYGTLVYADVREHGRRIDQLEQHDRAADTRAVTANEAVVRLQASAAMLEEAVRELRVTMRDLSSRTTDRR